MPEIGLSLRSGYLPVIIAADWAQALQEAQEGLDEPGWRTVMVRNSNGEFGVTAPQDASDEPVLALFTGPPDNPQAVAYRFIGNTYLNVSDGGHCAPSSRGTCRPGSCGGCRPRKVWDPAAGEAIKCRCPDQPPN
jgi:hypothetical protein